MVMFVPRARQLISTGFFWTTIGIYYSLIMIVMVNSLRVINMKFTALMEYILSGFGTEHRLMAAVVETTVVETMAVVASPRRRWPPLSLPWPSSRCAGGPPVERAVVSRLTEAGEALAPVLARIVATDALIDQVVYQLYGLSTEEVAVVEGTV